MIPLLAVKAMAGAALCAVMAMPATYAVDIVADEALDEAVASAAVPAADDNATGAAAVAPAVQPAAQPASVGPAASAPDARSMAPATIQVGDSVLPYIDDFEAETAPRSGAGLWMGADSTTDGSWGYFIGHNPGPFHEVMDLREGDAVRVCDRQGNMRTYHVAKAFRVTDDTCWEDISAEVTGYGESVVLQTCCGDNAHYRIVVCA